MLKPKPTVLEGHGLRLEPLGVMHATELAEAASDGNLWELWYTTVPSPDEVRDYIEMATSGQDAGVMLPFAVRHLGEGKVIGSTRFHDIWHPAERLEIGYTWYASRHQRTKVNAAAKLLLMRHAFEELQAKVVGFRTDNFNFRSQHAIEALGAKRDGMIRHHAQRRDGSIRDTVMYSILKAEWPDVQRNLELRLRRADRG